ncbi:MAG: hypothetical protein R3F02_11860 [Thiolinea sp.]
MSFNRQDKLLVSWMLTLVLMMTPWLSFWTTPVLGHAQNGEQVVLCSLKTVTIDQNGKLVTAATERCPALELLKVFSQTVHTATSYAPGPVYPTRLSVITSNYHYSVPHLSVYAGRAPPFA